MTRNTVQRVSRLAALMLMVAPLALAMPQQGESPEAMLGAGLHLEEVEADLEGAIAKYEQVVAHPGADRATAGRALLRVGMCHEKLGNPEAVAAYERVISEYPDRPEVVSEALARLRSLGVAEAVSLPGQELVSRRIFQFPPRMHSGGSPSPDGRYFSRTDWETGNIALMDLSNQEMRRLSDEGYPGMPYGSIFSPDSRTIAYGWMEESDDGFWDLRLINVDGTDQRVLYDPPGAEFGMPQSWSADGQWILALTFTESSMVRIELISVADGSARIVKELSDFESAAPGVQPLASLSPDGRFIAYDMGPVSGDGQNISVISVEDGTEWPLVQSPATDNGPMWTPDGSQVLFVSNRGGSFDLWAQDVAEGRAQGMPELLRAGIGAVRGITMDGSLYYGLARTVFDIRTASYDADTGTFAAQSQRSFTTRAGLNNRPLWSPDGRRLIYYHRPAATPAGGSRVLIMVDPETGQEREFTLSRREFGGAFKPLGWSPDGNRVLLYGFGREPNVAALYWLNVETGSTERALEGYAANARLSPDGTTVYAPNLRPDGIAAIDLTTGEERRIGPAMAEGVSVFGFALSPDGQTLAYQPTIDGVPAGGPMLMDVASGRTRSLGDLPQYWELAWTPDGRYLLGTRSPEDSDGVSDGSVEAVVWKIPLDGGAPEPTPITIGSDPTFAGMTFHPDGRTLTYVDGTQAREIWVLENLLPGVGAGR